VAKHIRHLRHAPDTSRNNKAKSSRSVLDIKSKRSHVAGIGGFCRYETTHSPVVPVTVPVIHIFPVPL